MTVCKICSRHEYGVGILAIEAARLSNGVSPIVDPLLSLEASHDEDELDRYLEINSRFEQLLAFGELEQPRQFRSMGTPEDLWEIKTPQDRIGCYERSAVPGIHVRTLRLTHMWSKTQNKTEFGKAPRRQLNFGDKIIREDKASGT